MRKKLFGALLFIGLLGLCACGKAEKGTEGEPTKAPIEINEPEPEVLPTATPEPTPEPTPTPLPADETAPELTLFGDEVMKVIARSEYVDPGFTATDDRDGDVTASVAVSGEVNVNWCDTYTLTYTVSDAAGNQTTVERVVEVAQPETIVPEGKVIYMTFDDGPGDNTRELLKILEKYQVKATFFVCANGVEYLYPEIKAGGHTIGAHCGTHDYNVVYASDEAYFKDLERVMNAIYEKTGEYTTLIRFPGGSSNKVSQISPGIMTRLTEKVTKMGYQYFDWHVDSGDSSTKDTAEILEIMKREVQKRNCSVVLQHPEHRNFSLAAVEDFIVWALDNGYTFMALDPTSPKAQHRVNN